MYFIYNYLAIHNKNTYCYREVKNLLQVLDPKSNLDDIESHMIHYANKLDSLINETLQNIFINHHYLFGFSMQFGQWLFASIVAEKIKKYNKDSLILVGGIYSKAAAVDFLSKFQQFDIALWGEGEKIVHEIANLIRNDRLKTEIYRIHNIAYRNHCSIKCSEDKQSNRVDLSYPNFYMNYHDYLKQLDKYKQNTNSIFPIETSRGCFWSKCHFCYLNHGYTYQMKSISKVKKEILYLINKYQKYSFFFTDNDITTCNQARFNSLLNIFIEIADIHPLFKIEVAEISTKILNKDIIKKMSSAHIKNVQIGYEFPSDNVLKKIEKLNTFASNILTIKFALKYNINIIGLNIIMDLPEANDSDIIEATDNISYLRFFISSRKLHHIYNPVHINQSSKYFNTISKDKYWIISERNFLLANKIVNDENWTIFNYIKPKFNLLWELFKQKEQYYRKNRFNYKIVQNNEFLTYIETCNDKIIKNHSFSIYSLEYKILKFANDKVVTISDLNKLHGNKYSYLDIMNVINNLTKLQILYFSHIYNELISIIELES